MSNFDKSLKRKRFLLQAVAATGAIGGAVLSGCTNDFVGTMGTTGDGGPDQWNGLTVHDGGEPDTTTSPDGPHGVTPADGGSGETDGPHGVTPFDGGSGETDGPHGVTPFDGGSGDTDGPHGVTPFDGGSGGTDGPHGVTPFDGGAG